MGVCLIQRAGAVDDDRALITDQWLVEPCRLERSAHRSDHPPGDHDHVEACLVRAPESRDRSRPENAVLPDERAVEVGRDDADVMRERCRKLQAQPFGLPPDALTT